MRSPSSTSSSRRVAAVAAAALAALQLGLVAFGHPSAFFPSALGAWQYEKARQLERRAGIDVIAMGNSQMHVGFHAALFSRRTGLESFNFSLDGADVVGQAAVLREIAVPSFRPTRVVWGISPRDLNANPRWLEHTHHRGILAGPAVRTASLPGGWRLIPFAKDLLPFHRRSWSDWSRVFWHWASRKPPVLDERGWRPRSGRYQPGPFEQARAGFYYEAVFSPEWLALVVESLAALRSRGIDVVVVTLPVHHNTLGLFDPEKLGEARAHLAGLARAAGVPHLDWLERAELADAALFHDAIHLNTRGAERFTELLADAVAARAAPLRQTAALR